jgi:transcriptional regulator with XRE-family HTH domain
MLLKEMAENVGMSSSWLSGIETGRKPIPADLPEKIVLALRLTEKEAATLRSAAEESKKNHTLRDVRNDRADVAVALARRFNELSTEELEAIREIVNRRRA